MKKLLIALLILGFAAPAMAADWNFYGSFRTHLGYYDVDQEYLGGPGMDSSIGHMMDDDSGLQFGLGGNSVFGAKVMVSDDLSAVLETGLMNNTRQGYAEDVYLRQAFGSWDFGEGTLIAGKTYTPAIFGGYSKMCGNIGFQCDGAMFGAGLPYIGRRAQLQFRFGGLQFALIDPKDDADDYASSLPVDGVDKDFTLPRIEAAYGLAMGNINLRAVAGYQTYDLEGYSQDPVTLEWESEGDESIDSFLLGLGAKVDLKPAYVNVALSYLKNSGNYGNGDYGNVNTLAAYTGSGLYNAQFVDNEFEDSTLLQGVLVAGFRVSPMVSLEAGLGHMSGEVDIPATVLGNDSGATAEQTSMIYYGQAWISMSENVHIIPEVGVVDRGDLEIEGVDDIENGKMVYFDVAVRFEF